MTKSNAKRKPSLNRTTRRYSHLTERPGREKRTQLFLDAISAVQTSTCLVGINGPCHNPTVEGHIIPESRLESISQGKEVIVAEFPPITHLPTIGDYHYQRPFRPVRTTIATTDRFSCQPHDLGVFQSAEQNEIDWQSDPKAIMKTLALLDYKAVLSTYARQDRNARIWEQLASVIDPGDPDLLLQNALNMAGWERTYANRTKKVKDDLEWMLRHKDYDHMTHFVVQTGPKPLVAANSFFTLAYNLAETPGRLSRPHRARPAVHHSLSLDTWPNCDQVVDHSELSTLNHSQRGPQQRSRKACPSASHVHPTPRTVRGYCDFAESLERLRGSKATSNSGTLRKTVPYSPSPIQSVEQYPEPQLLNLFNTIPFVI